MIVMIYISYNLIIPHYYEFIILEIVMKIIKIIKKNNHNFKISINTTNSFPIVIANKARY